MAKSRGWSTPPSLFAGVVEDQLALRVRTISAEILQLILLASPVDTGRFRGNNIVSIGAPVYTVSAAVDPDSGETFERGLSVMSGLAPFTQVFIQNNLPYAVPLEDGQSKKAPAGIYGVSFNSVAQKYSS
ncbi:HK97 gp10 family phage protein [Pseudomonas mosselii]|uniref:HK97 gp10 family phage protein n=1 Tax=Pseudomonas mosselii TaxID=78327 RepID=UPI0021DA6799|nr:HK97 gp10 family phage protein [Pseudomonas mosselii]MCU9528735.1 HK97 gp10 family phage protein [Pseudomonas mosselii]MCU9536070.1 HK97 gp10 family phage protein [Pseudomonas mosselii]MCU9541705.1 HK97 gp10 family phage protein [Pseudomonas mosselii]MCU9547664.1 HK97 gp10 family phage protein [Pseudomonas mosselii]